MGVDVQGHRHGGVAEPLADDLRVHAGLQNQGSVSVPQVMEADPRQPSTEDLPVELPADVLEVQRGPRLGG